MAEFLGDLAFMVEVFVLGLGLWFVFLGRKESSKLVTGAGWFMSGAAAFGLICTTFFYFKYWNAGEFDHAYPQHKMMGSEMHQMMMGGKSQHMMMNPQMMQNLRHSMMTGITECMQSAQGKTMEAKIMDQIKNCMQSRMNSQMPLRGVLEGHKSHHK